MSTTSPTSGPGNEPLEDEARIVAENEDHEASWRGVAAEWSRIGGYWLDAENTHRYDGHDLVNIHANVPVGSRTIITSAPRFDPLSESVGLVEGSNTYDVVLTSEPVADVDVLMSFDAAQVTVTAN